MTLGLVPSNERHFGGYENSRRRQEKHPEAAGETSGKGSCSMVFLAAFIRAGKRVDILTCFHLLLKKQWKLLIKQ